MLLFIIFIIVLAVHIIIKRDSCHQKHAFQPLFM